MRLIDADKFTKEIASMAVVDGSTIAAERASALIKLVESQATAYDYEKVIKELTEYANGYICDMQKGCPFIENDKLDCANCGAIGTIEIVKGGLLCD